MLAWKRANPLTTAVYQFRVAKAQYKYFDHIGLIWPRRRIAPRLGRKRGYQSQLSSLKDKHSNKPAVIICNGPSLNQTPLDFMSSMISIGCNGIYKNFDRWGFHTDYLMFEDIDQFELRAPDMPKVKGPMKLTAIYNAYCLRDARDFLFFNAPRRGGDWRYYFHSSLFPQFSRDFSSIVHLGSTITYIMLQFAYHLGCNPVYIVGLDHDYAGLSSDSHRVLKITGENYADIQRCHNVPDYYRVGDVMPLPRYDLMELAYSQALKEYELAGRTLLNASAQTKLTVLPRFTISS
jgi:hypothetical protein